MGIEARHVLVRGRVQGVAFRWHTLDQARALALAGWVRNLPDGRVEVHLEGRPAAADRLVAWLERGPPAAHVDGIEVQPVPPEGATSFEILG